MNQDDLTPADSPAANSWGNGDAPAEGYGQFGAGTWRNPSGFDSDTEARESGNTPDSSRDSLGGVDSFSDQHNSFSDQHNFTPPSFASGVSESKASRENRNSAGFQGRADFSQVQPGIIPLRPLGLSDIFNGAFRALREAPSVMFGLVLGIWCVFSVLNAIAASVTLPDYATLSRTLNQQNPATTIDSLMGLLEQACIVGIPFAVIQVAIVGLTTGIGVAAVAPLVLGKRPSVADTWEATKPHLWKLIGLSFLVQAIILGIYAVVFAPLALIIPGIINQDFRWLAAGALLTMCSAIGGLIFSVFIFVRLTFTVPSIVMEGIGVRAALRRSWRLTRGSFWRILGIIVLTYMILGAVMAGLGMVVSIVTALAGFVVQDFRLLASINAAFSSIITGLYIPFVASVVSLLYVDLRMRREGLALTLLRAAQQDRG